MTNSGPRPPSLFTTPSTESLGAQQRSFPYLLGLAATLLCLAGSWHVSLWTDEAATISASRRSLAELWQMIGTIDAVHAVYYAAMHFWTAAFGISPVALRLPSALAIGISAVVAYHIAARLGGRNLALLSTMVFMVLPRVTWLGIEARPYAFTVLGAALMTLVLLMAIEKPGYRWWIGYALLTTLSIGANIYVALLLVAHGTSLLVSSQLDWKLRFHWLASSCAGVLLTAPLVLESSQQTGQLGGDELRWSELLRNVVVNQWFLGETPTTTTGVTTTSFAPGSPSTWWQPAAIGLALLCWSLIAAGIGSALRRRGVRDAIYIWATPWVVLPTAIIGVYSIYVHPMYSPRYLSFASPAVAVLIAAGLLALGKRWLRSTAMSLILICALPVYLSQRTLYAKSGTDWVAVAEYVAANGVPGDYVYFAPRFPLVDGRYGQSTRGIETAYPQSFSGLIDLTLEESPEASGTLTGWSTPLSASEAALESVATLLVIQRVDYPLGSAQADAEILSRAGLRKIASWTGPLDRVLIFSRN